MSHSTTARPWPSRTRPIIVEPGRAADPCASCGARSDSVCAVIDDQDLQHLAAVAIVTHVAAGMPIITEGDPAIEFVNISSGTARLYKVLPDGRRQITGFARAGTFLGLAASGINRFSAEAVDAVRYCRLPRKRLMSLLDDFPALERRLIDYASTELAAAQDQMLLLGRKTARERLASFLVTQQVEALPCGHHADEIILPMTRIDIADYLGLTIETVSRTFTRLKSEGLIAILSANRIRLIDRAALTRLAEGD